MARHLWLAAAAMSMSVTGGCDPAVEAEVLTSNVHALLAVGASGSGMAEARLELRVGSATGTRLELGAGDGLTVSDPAGSNAVSRRDGSGGAWWYEAGRLADAEDTAYVIAFERTIDDGAPSSTVTMPPPFDMSEPSSGQALSRSTDAVTVRWNPAGAADEMRWTAVGECLEPVGAPVTGDPAVVVLPPGALQAIDGHEQETCDVTIEVSRERAGELDSAYAGGFMVARQVRTVVVSSTP